MLVDHLDGILNYCRTKVRFGLVEAINGNINSSESSPKYGSLRILVQSRKFESTDPSGSQ
jgi:hypothetical protein